MFACRLSRLAASLGQPAARSGPAPLAGPPGVLWPLLGGVGCPPSRGVGRVPVTLSSARRVPPFASLALVHGACGGSSGLAATSPGRAGPLALPATAPCRGPRTLHGGPSLLGGDGGRSGGPGEQDDDNDVGDDGDDDDHVDLGAPPTLDEADLVEKFVRGSGRGGQKINKTSSCVQLWHTPSGLSVSVQASRSQARNRVLARRALARKLDDAVRGAASAAAMEASAARARKARRRRKCIKKHFKSRGDRAAMDG